MIRRTFYKRDAVCSAAGCDVVLHKGQLFCKGHYFSLPTALRWTMLDAWRAAREAYRLRKPRVEQNALNADYQAAFQTCCEHLRTVRPTTADAMSTIAFAASGQPVAYVGGRML